MCAADGLTSPNARTDLLIIGAGPFGLAIAAHAKHLGIDHMVVGKPMEFWKRHMPANMYLRSGVHWHLDASGLLTIERFLSTRGLTASDVDPFPLDVYLSYCEWFERQMQLEITSDCVVRLDRVTNQRHAFRAALSDGREIQASHVVVAVGFEYFAHIPADLTRGLSPGRFEHTCTAVHMEQLSAERCLIVGGRQSAFEWAALAAEAGAASVDLSYRHDTPRFVQSEWLWVDELVQSFIHEPGWYRRLPQEEREALVFRFWQEGRLKLEPWLEPRIRAGGVRLWPGSRIVAASETSGGAMLIRLDSGNSIEVDRIIFATGYKPDLTRVPFLSAGNLLADIDSTNGCPALDDVMQSSVPSLYFTSMLATRDFGPFFAFTVSARTAARLVGRGLQAESRLA